MPLARVHVPSGGIIPRGDKDAILNSIVETYRSSPTSSKDHHRKKYKGKPRSKIHKISKCALKPTNLVANVRIYRIFGLIRNICGETDFKLEF
jgi:hypothetical protein